MTTVSLWYPLGWDNCTISFVVMLFIVCSSVSNVLVVWSFPCASVWYVVVCEGYLSRLLLRFPVTLIAFRPSYSRLLRYCICYWYPQSTTSGEDCSFLVLTSTRPVSSYVLPWTSICSNASDCSGRLRVAVLYVQIRAVYTVELPLPDLIICNIQFHLNLR